MKSVLHFLFLASAACFVGALNFRDFSIFIPYPPIPSCPSNEIYKFCLDSCSDCDQRGNCLVSNCSTKGCDCMQNFVRLTPDGPCVHVSQCPLPECPENEAYRECGPVCERCLTMQCQVINCDHKCYCKTGYLRNAEGKCIPSEDCPKRSTCGINEEWAESGSVNEYCLTEKGKPPKNETQNVPKCYCKDGYKRNIMGICIDATVCPLIQCRSGETYRNCIPKCNATYHSYGDPDCKEDGNCYAGCFCPPGEAMNYYRTCVSVSNSTTDNTQEEEMEESASTNKDNSYDFDNSTEISIDDNTDTSETTYYPDTDGTSEDDHIEETSSASEASAKDSDTVSSESPPANPKESRGKDNSKARAFSSARSSKHTNAAASSKASKQKGPDYFANE